MNKLFHILENVAIAIIGVLVVSIFILNIVVVNNIKQELSYIYAGIDTINYYLSQMEKRIKDQTIDNIKKNIELMDKINRLSGTMMVENSILEGKIMASVCDLGIASIRNDRDLDNSIKKLKEQIERNLTEPEQIENKLKQVTVMIENISQGYQGSGVTIKYKDNYYILSVNHLIGDKTDELFIAENDQPFAKLKIIKTDKTRDLALFKLEDENKIPEVYAELAEKELDKGSSIYVIGNPLGIEDVLSEGRILKNNGFQTYFIDHSYFGSSGGGIFTKEGKLLGIIQTLGQIKLSENDPGFVINGAGRLSMIKDFLGDVDKNWKKTIFNDSTKDTK
jgi:prefoldin subunit 5